VFRASVDLYRRSSFEKIEKQAKEFTRRFKKKNNKKEGHYFHYKGIETTGSKNDAAVSMKSTIRKSVHRSEGAENGRDSSVKYRWPTGLTDVTAKSDLTSGDEFIKPKESIVWGKKIMDISKGVPP